MCLKVKAFCLGLLAVLAISNFTVGSATAETGGHFVSAVSHTTISGSEGLLTSDVLEFTITGLEGGIVCEGASYDGTIASATVTELLLNPFYPSCHTTGSAENVTIHENGCQYRLTVAPEHIGTVEGTLDIVCPKGFSLTMLHPNCTIQIPAQNNLKSIIYTTVTEFGVHAITVDVNAQFNLQFEGGICTLLGTTHTGTLKGSLVLKGTNTSEELVSITAT